MTHQRFRYGKPVTLFPTVKTVDRDGAEVLVPDMDNPIRPGNGIIIQDRAQRAEVPGQMEVDVLNLIMPYVPGINSWWRVHFDGEDYDVVGPPNDRKLTARHVKHTSVLIRRRGVQHG